LVTGRCHAVEEFIEGNAVLEFRARYLTVLVDVHGLMDARQFRLTLAGQLLAQFAEGYHVIAVEVGGLELLCLERIDHVHQLQGHAPCLETIHGTRIRTGRFRGLRAPE